MWHLVSKNKASVVAGIAVTYVHLGQTLALVDSRLEEFSAAGGVLRG